MPDITAPAPSTSERTMPTPVIAAGLVLVGVLLGVGLAAKLLPTRKVLYPVEGPPRPCEECERQRQMRDSAKAAADAIVATVNAHEAGKADAAAPESVSDEAVAPN